MLKTLALNLTESATSRNEDPNEFNLITTHSSLAHFHDIPATNAFLPFEARKQRFRDVKDELDQYMYGVRRLKRLRDYTIDERYKSIKLLDLKENEKFKLLQDRFERTVAKYFSE